MKLAAVFASALVIEAGAFAQTMVESAVAAAGGSAAAVAGKKVSDGVDKVFTKLGTIADGMGSTNLKDTLRRLPTAAPAMPTVRTQTHGTPMPVQAAASRATAYRLPSRGLIQVIPDSLRLPEPPQQFTSPAEPARPLPTASDLRALHFGASRDEVIDKMGKPASRITMNDERGLVETYTFRGESGSLGSVRLVNGKIEEVRPVQ
jgi:hypothetical protein